MGVKTSRQTRNNKTTVNAGHSLDYKTTEFADERGGTDAPPPTDSIQATGGIVNTYEVSGTTYKAHVFTSSGTFEITELSASTNPNNLDYLIVAGGGGGGGSSGGGAGGVIYETGIAASAQTYPVVVGAGGDRIEHNGNAVPAGINGGNSAFNGKTAKGGGGGGGWDSPNNASPGGSGGGARIGHSNGEGSGTGPGHPGGIDAVTPGPIITAGGWGNPGGARSPGPYYGSGGGGAHTAGGAGGNNPAGNGGNGARYSIYDGTTNYYWGGGGGGGNQSANTSGAGGLGGGSGGGSNGGGTGGAAPSGPELNAGGAGSTNAPGESGGGPYGTAGDAGASTGGGGGGMAISVGRGGAGGSGIVIVRYAVTSPTSTKATGGVVSYAGGKTIHTFTKSGTFHNPVSLNVDFLMVGGGGGGGADNGGGGAGGEVVVGSNYPLPASPRGVVIGAGGIGQIGNHNQGGAKGTSTTFNSLFARSGSGGSAAALGDGKDGGPVASGSSFGGGGGAGTSPGPPLTGELLELHNHHQMSLIHQDMLVVLERIHT